MAIKSKLVPEIQTLQNAGFGITSSVKYADLQLHLYNSENQTIKNLIGSNQLKDLIEAQTKSDFQNEIYEILQSVCVLDALANSNYTASIKRSTLGNQIFQADGSAPVFSEMTENLIQEQNLNLQNLCEILIKQLDLYCQTTNYFNFYKNEKYAQRKGLFVWNESLYSKFADINNSVYFYYRVLSILRDVQNELNKIIGDVFLKYLQDKMIEASNFDGFNQNEKDLLNNYIIKYIVYRTHNQALIEQALKVDHKGVVVYNTNPTQDTGGNAYKYIREVATQVASNFEKKARCAMNDLVDYLDNNSSLFPNYSKPNFIGKTNIPENKNTPTFWL